MSDFYAKRVFADGVELWKILEVGTNQVLAVGNTVSQAVENYETYVLNETAKEKLDIDIDDLTF